MRYDVLRKSILYSLNYRVPKGFFGNHISVDYIKSAFWSLFPSRDYRNLIKESSVNSLNEGVVLNLTSPGGMIGLGYSFMWRDLSPAVDLDVERIMNSHCSKRSALAGEMIASIINECRPSIKSSIFSTLTLDSRNSRVIPTAGSYAQLRLVLLLPPPYPQSYSGFLGDVNQFRTELHANTNFAVSPAIFGEPGLALHLYGYGGFIRNLHRKKTRYFDRFFLSKEGGKGVLGSGREYPRL